MEDKNDMTDRIFVISVQMEGRIPEDIARDAAKQIVTLFDKLVEKKNEQKKEKRNGSGSPA